MAASLLGSLLVKVKGDNSDLDKSLDKSESSVKKFSKFAVAAYAAVGVAIIALSKKYIAAFAVQEKAETSLRAAIKATGKESQISVNRLKKYASSLQDVTLFGDEATLSGLALLQSLANLDEKGLKNVTPSILDFAQATGTDLQTAMSLVGKTLGSSTNALARYGIEIDTSGTKAEKLAQLTEAMTSKFGGAAEAAGNMATGDLIQLSNSFGDVSEGIGGLIATGINPFVNSLIPVVSSLASWVSKQNEINTLIKGLKNNSVDADVSLSTMQETLVKLNKDLATSIKYAVGDSVAIQGQIKEVEKLISVKQRERYNARTDHSAAEKAAEAERLAGEKAAEVQQLVIDRKRALMTEDELQLESLQLQIDKWAEYRDIVGVQEYLNQLITDRNALTTEGTVALTEAIPVTNEYWRQEREGAAALTEEIKVVDATLLALTESGLGAFAAAFEEVGAGAISVWGGIKQAGKDAISAVLKGLAKEAIIRAAIAAATLRFGKAGRLVGAATLAYAASGFVQQLADGGVLAPTSGGTPAIMAEAGVPEMAVPLKSSATDPFADKIASRINNTTNNTQNFNSMFSLSDDNKLRETARRLFPFMENEKIRRGMA